MLKKGEGTSTEPVRGACRRDEAATTDRKAQTLLWSANTAFDLVLPKFHPEFASILFNHLNTTSAGRPSSSAKTNQPTTKGGSTGEGVYLGFGFLGHFG